MILKMTEENSDGFQTVRCPIASSIFGGPSGNMAIVRQSPGIGPYPDADAVPGSSYLWIGEHHYLDRENVRELYDYLSHWLSTGLLWGGTFLIGNGFPTKPRGRFVKRPFEPSPTTMKYTGIVVRGMDHAIWFETAKVERSNSRVWAKDGWGEGGAQTDLEISTDAVEGWLYSDALQYE